MAGVEELVVVDYANTQIVVHHLHCRLVPAVNIPLLNVQVYIFCACVCGKCTNVLSCSKSHKSTNYLLSDSMAALVRHSQAQKCLQINSKPLH